MNIIAFDSSLKRSAWAGVRDGVVMWDSRSFIKPNDKEFPDLRFHEWRLWAAGAIEFIEPSVCVLELPTPHGGASGKPQIMLEMTLRELCAVRRIKVKAIYPTALKLYLTGNGKADKSEMMQAVAARINGYDPVLDIGGDVGDALAQILWMQDGAPESQAAQKRRAKKELK